MKTGGRRRCYRRVSLYPRLVDKQKSGCVLGWIGGENSGSAVVAPKRAVEDLQQATGSEGWTPRYGLGFRQALAGAEDSVVLQFGTPTRGPQRLRVPGP